MRTEWNVTPAAGPPFNNYVHSSSQVQKQPDARTELDFASSSECPHVSKKEHNATLPTMGNNIRESPKIPKKSKALAAEQPIFERLFVDFNYLVGSKLKIVIKEMAIVGRTKDGTAFQQCFLVHSPIYSVNDVDSEARSVSENLTARHGITWLDGDVSMGSIHRLVKLYNNSSSVYVPDESKARVLKNIFYFKNNVCNIQGLLLDDSTKEITPQPLFCAFHINKADKICALNNARLMSIRFDTQQYMRGGLWKIK